MNASAIMLIQIQNKRPPEFGLTEFPQMDCDLILADGDIATDLSAIS